MSAALVMNFAGALIAPYFIRPEPKSFLGLIEYARLAVAGKLVPISLIDSEAARHGPGFWRVFVWPMLACAEFLSGISLIVSWWTLKRVSTCHKTLGVAAVAGGNLFALALMFILTEFAYIHARFKLGVALSAHQWWDMYRITMKFDATVAKIGIIPQAIWWFSESLPMILCFALVATYIGIWKAPDSARRKVQHVADRLIQSGGREKTILGQIGSFAGWVLAIVGSILFLLRMSRRL
jgi:hypothetical protein